MTGNEFAFPTHTPKGHLHVALGDAKWDLLVQKDLSLKMAEQDFILALLQQGGAVPGGPGQSESEPVCPAITDHSFLPCSGRQTAVSSWTAAIPSPEGEPPCSR